MKKSIIGLLVTIALTVACEFQTAWGTETVINSREVRIARVVERYVATHFPTFESLKYEMVVNDERDKLVVYFKLPHGAIGGTPTVVLKKDSLEVIQAYRTQ